MNRALTLFLLLTTGCLGGVSGSWELEVEDADHCEMTLDLNQSGEDVDGDASISCDVYTSVYGETYRLEYRADRAEQVVGRRFDDEVELEIDFDDDAEDWEFTVHLELRQYDDTLEGDVLLDDDLFDMLELGEGIARKR